MPGTAAASHTFMRTRQAWTFAFPTWAVCLPLRMRNIYVSFQNERTHLWAGGAGPTGKWQEGRQNSQRQTNKQLDRAQHFHVFGAGSQPELLPAGILLAFRIFITNVYANLCHRSSSISVPIPILNPTPIPNPNPNAIPGRWEHQLNTFPQTNCPNGTKTNRRQVEDWGNVELQLRGF